MTEEDINCYTDEGHVRCEIDGQEVQLTDQDAHRNAIKDAGYDPVSPEACAGLTEETIEAYRSDDYLGGETLGKQAIALGCPLPHTPSEERDVETVNRGRRAIELEEKDDLE